MKWADKWKEEEVQVYEAAFKLYVEHKIESVSVANIADHTDYGVATLFRHYNTKLELAARTVAYMWGKYFAEAFEGRTPEYLKDVPAIERLSFTYDLYIDLYKNHKDLLRVNDNFNHFYHDNKNAETIPGYADAFGGLSERFHDMYEKAKIDGTMRTDIPEDELQRVLLHTMMGACIHYLGGFSFGETKEQDYTRELIRLKEILIDYAKGN